MKRITLILVFLLTFLSVKSQTDYILRTDPVTAGLYVSFDSPLINGTQWALEFDVSNYQELDTPGQFAGSGSRFDHYLAFSESGQLGGELASGIKILSGINETIFLSTEWVNVKIWSDGTDIFFDVNNGTLTGSATPSDANTSFTLDYFISGSSGTPPTDAADGKYNNLRTWDLSAYGGTWDRASVFAETPNHEFLFDEGTGNTLSDTYSAVIGTINNPYVGQWEEYAITTWIGQTVNTDGTHTDSRPDQNMWYDHYDNITYVVWMGLNGNKYINTIDHNNNDAVGTPVLVQSVTAYDSHSYPNIVMTDDGYILVIGTDYGGDVMQIARSTNPRDISTWTTNTFTTGYYDYPMWFPEYPKPIKSRNGDIYIFHKQRPDNQNTQVIRWWYYIKSIDGGVTWSNRVLCFSRSGDVDNLNEVYVGQMTVEPYRIGEPEKVWATWIAAGGPTHDDYHHDLYAAYFRFDTEEWYGPNNISLGTDIDITEMDGDVQNIQIFASPRDPLGVYSGYINPIYPDNTGEIRVNAQYSWSGADWVDISPTGLPGDYNLTRWADGYWYALGGGSVFRAANGRDFTVLEDYTTPGNHSRAQSFFQSVTDNPEHANAIAHVLESETTQIDNYGWVLNSNTDFTPAALYANATARTITQTETTTVRVYVTDKFNGSRSRVTTATDNISLTVVSGNTTVVSSPVSAINGLAEFSVVGPSNDEEAILEATATGLDSYRINITTTSVAAALNLVLVSTDISCNGADDGVIDAIVSGGVPPYSYSWSSGQTTEDITGLTAGTYTLTVTDSNLDQVSDNVTINEPSILLISGLVTNENLGSDGAIDITVSGGTIPYSYSWSSGQTTEDITGLIAGTYTLTVTDFNSCIISNPFIVGSNDTTEIVSTLLAIDGHADDIRPMGTGVYDRENNLTYMVYMNTIGLGDAFVYTCDHNNNNAWDNGNTVGVATQDDSHNYPQIILPDDNRPVVVFGAHNIALKISKMDVAGDPTSWTTTTLSQVTDGSYPMIIKSRNGDLYVFYRATIENTIRPMYYIKSTDYGVTWSNPVMAIQRLVDAEGFREIYVGMIDEEPYQNEINQRFHFVWTLSGASIPAGNHDWAREGLYHAYFEPTTETFYSANGTNLGSSINEIDMDTYCEIVSPQRDPLRQGYMGYFQMVSVGVSNDILVWEFHDDGTWEDVVHYWNGVSWEIQTGTGLSVYPKGIDYFNGKHYFIGNSRNNIFQGTSDFGDTFTNDYSFAMVNADPSSPTTTIPIREGHHAARFWAKETAAEPCNVWSGAIRGDGIGVASNLRLNITDATVDNLGTTTVRVYISDNVGGSFARVTTATNNIALNVLSGDATITSNPIVAAVNGRAEFTIQGGQSNSVLQATSTGLTSGEIVLYTNYSSRPPAIGNAIIAINSSEFNTALGTVTPGDTVYIAGDLDTYVTCTVSGSNGLPIYIKKYPTIVSSVNAKMDIDGDYYDIDSISFISGVNVNGNNVTIHNSNFETITDTAVVINQVNNFDFQYNTITGSGNIIYFSPSSGDYYGESIIINNNDYQGIINGLFNGDNWGIWRRKWGKDKNSTF